ncbi:MAG: beta-xylosidase [Candidatus Sumerlaeota bacterium]|nr:beta-xylosidase [Candidatus Sumerlaeota bacterium]
MNRNECPDNATVRVDAADRLGPFDPIWNCFCYDECNYTYMKYGKPLLGEIAALSPAPAYIRAHCLLNSGDGTAALKWGSSNAYTEDAQERPVYDWTIIDRIFDAYRDADAKPLVEIGFMPEALSIKPRPYRHDFPNTSILGGWAYPPKDHGKWAELVFQWARHSTERYGREEVETWLWEVWNEPDIHYWQGTPDEYFQLYDFAVDAVKRAIPNARVGGPDSTGPRSERASNFLRQFLEHCISGTNYATGKTGAPLDFIAFHAKGRPSVVDGHVQMGISPHLESIAKGFEIVASFPEWRSTPIILGESDPEGGAARTARLHPANAYRNGSQYPAYTAAVLGGVYSLAATHRSNIRGVVTWAFEFEDQPYFDGFRTLATNGIDKPILNLFRMLGLMDGERLRARSSGALGVDEMLKAGACARPDIDALAAGREGEASVLVWNYHDDDVPAPDASIHLIVENLPTAARRVLIRRYQIDERHSNAFTVWKEMGAPQNPSADEYARLQAAGQLAAVGSPEWRDVVDGSLTLDFTLPRQGVALIQASWNEESGAPRRD